MTSMNKKSRVVSLVDMDCFYVQVVQRKDPSLLGKPCAVVQYKAWKGGGIIAVGYEARKFGVTRQMRGDEAKQKCPDIVLVHVPESRGKADLTQFREAGAEVIEVLSTFTDCLERASIDEAYLDLTNSLSRYMAEFSLEEIALRTFQTTHLIGLNNLEEEMNKEEIITSDLFKQWVNTLKNDQGSYNLAIGAVIADDMREAVKGKTGFSCSAGIGPNKVLAKVVAGFHKPDQQTLVLPENVAEMFQTTKVRKVRNFGGKLGSQLEEKFKVQYMSELCDISLNALQSHVGEKNGELVYWLCRGIDHEPVRPRQLPKSVGCSKNFMGKEMLTTKEDVYKWMTNLAEEVWERLEKEKENNNRVATLFTVGCTNEKKQHQSKRCSVIKQSVTLLRDEAFRALCEMNKNRSGESWTPGLVNLSFCASKFESTALAGSKSISKYMCSGSDISVAGPSDFMKKFDAKKTSPIKNKESKAILNYFSVNREKLRELGGSNVDNTKVDGIPLVTENGVNDNYSFDVSSSETSNGYQNLCSAELLSSTVQQTRQEASVLNNISRVIEKEGDDRVLYDEVSDATLEDSLPEDPLDFTRCDASLDAQKTEGMVSKPAGFPSNDFRSLFTDVDNTSDSCTKSDIGTNISRQDRVFSNVSFKSRTESKNKTIPDKMLQRGNNVNSDLSSRLPYKFNDLHSEKHNAGKKREDALVSMEVKRPVLMNSGIINFANSRDSKTTVNTSYSGEECLITSIPATYPFDKKYRSVDNINSTTTPQPRKKGHFATLKNNRHESNALLPCAKNFFRPQTLEREVRVSSETSREGYFASLRNNEDEPEVDNFFALMEPDKHKKTENILKCDDAPSNNVAESDIMTCEKCGKRILMWDFPEHADFHYAKEVQNSMKKEFLSLYNNDVISPKKKKTKRNDSLLTYFSPTCKK